VASLKNRNLTVTPGGGRKGEKKRGLSGEKGRGGGLGKIGRSVCDEGAFRGGGEKAQGKGGWKGARPSLEW